MLGIPMAGLGASTDSFTPPPLASGSYGRYTRYTMLRRIATGGMGELLLARAAGARGVEKLVAIKRVRPEYAGDPEFVSMFLNEARLAAALDHPNVVRTYDLVEDAGSCFMVMEYLHGESLGRLLNAAVARDERIALPHVVTIGLGVAAGLHCAHERCGVDGRPLGIVHRDLSPGNVFITYEGGVKLLDFGIAKATSRTSITLGPARKGKVAYMSPEQCVGAQVDRRSDIFALGVVLWELSTGRRLFRGDNEFAIMNQITSLDAPSALDHAPELPAALASILARALQRDVQARYQDAMALHDDLEAFAQAHAVMPSSAALGRHLIELCGQREYPCVDPSHEFEGPRASTLVVPGAVAPVRRRRLSLVLALAAGAAVGAAGVAASSSRTTTSAAASPPELAPPMPAEVPSLAQTASARTEAPPPSEAPTADARTPVAPAGDPTPERPPSSTASSDVAAEVPTIVAPDDPPAPTRARRNERARRATTTTAAAREPAPAPVVARPVRGVDGLLPRGE